MYIKNRRGARPLKFVVIFLIIAIVLSGSGYLTFSYYQARQASIVAKEAADKQKAVEAAILAAKEAKKKEPVYITLPGAKQIRAMVDDYTKASSIWLVVNKTLPISIDYKPDKLVLPDVEERSDKSVEERSVRSDISEPLKSMFDTAKANGHNLMIGSAYRSAALQKTYFDNYAAASGEEAANKLSAHPGQSEHQTGLAVDISTVSRNCYLDACFTSTPDGQWLANNAYQYGFILRYPEGKESITGYNFEPWHYRYVGVDLATAIHESGLTLDQVLPYLQAAQKTLQDNGAI